MIRACDADLDAKSLKSQHLPICMQPRSCSLISKKLPSTAMQPVVITRTSILDAMQVVPQLLQACVTCCGGIRPVRLICKSASIIAIQAVRSYCIKISSQPSDDEPLMSVANLLEHTRLHHVRVEITVQAGVQRDFVSKAVDKHTTSQAETPRKLISFTCTH